MMMQRKLADAVRSGSLSAEEDVVAKLRKPSMDLPQQMFLLLPAKDLYL
jgi:hypothetical protein